MRFQKPGEDLPMALQHEWLETNGLGGFASSSIVGLNTRRYHALLTAALHPPSARFALLSKLEETWVVNGQRIELSCNQYPDAVHPQGQRYLQEFRLEPFPEFIYAAFDIEITKRVFMVYGENTTVIQYELRSGPDSKSTCTACELELRPLIAFRDYHSLTHKNDAINADVEVVAPGYIALMPYAGLPKLYVAHSEPADVSPVGEWFYNFIYERERERGLDDREDLFNPLVLKFNLEAGKTVWIIASTIPHDVGEAPALRDRELSRRRQIKEPSLSDDTFIQDLVAAADQFIAKRGELQTIIAGYHWFGDWGRDTMIALPGLTLVTRRFDIAKGILQAFAQVADRGMLPNWFPDAGESPEYNTVDATLWFFNAIYWLAEYTGDYQFVAESLYDQLREMIEWHIRGTRYGIRMNANGLLECGEPGWQLTWMDAKAGGRVVTPRQGMPVEVEALWYNALRIMEKFSGWFGRKTEARRYEEMAKWAKESFPAIFWNEENGYLYDVVDGANRDGSIRPNQIFTVSLAHPILEGKRALQVVEKVEHELLTPRGLRTLARSDKQYRPRYEGNPEARDSSYHQGTVWAWLLGPFVTAYLTVHGYSVDACQQARQWLSGFNSHLYEAGLGQVSEIFDGDPPHTPRGCIAQAWSVAEILRAMVEDVQDRGVIRTARHRP